MDIIRKLRNLRKQLRTEATREHKNVKTFTDRLSIEKAYGMAIAYEASANQIDKLLRDIDKAGKPADTKPTPVEVAAAIVATGDSVV
jgi:hypothetical protein